LALTIGIWVLALVGLGFLILGFIVVFRDMGIAFVSPSATPAATATAPPVVVIPTTTPIPATASATVASSPTAASSTATPTLAATTNISPTASAITTTAQIKIFETIIGANVRSGPGTNYPSVGGLAGGQTAPVIGRDSSAQWFVIEYATASNGQGWVANTVADYDGDVQKLPVIKAPPPPPATATPKAPPAPPPPVGSRGVVGKLTLCANKTTFGVGERICFVEWIKNTTTAAVNYGIIGVQAVNLSGGPNQFQTSWDGQLAPGGFLAVDAGCEGPTDRCKGQWEDGMRINTAGAYRLTLQICYSTFNDCLGGGDWETLSAPINVTVQ
jgi:hypothetical protein